MTLTAAATMVAPVLSNTASATCWLECRPPIIQLPTDDPDDDDGGIDEPGGLDPKTSACDEPGTEAAAIPWPIPCDPAYAWTCCSPPGGPVCCTPPGGGPAICSGGGIEPLSSTPELPADEVLECRADEVEPTVTLAFVQLLSQLT